MSALSMITLKAIRMHSKKSGVSLSEHKINDYDDDCSTKVVENQYMLNKCDKFPRWTNETILVD